MTTGPRDGAAGNEIHGDKNAGFGTRPDQAELEPSFERTRPGGSRTRARATLTGGKDKTGKRNLSGARLDLRDGTCTKAVSTSVCFDRVYV
jgi:hypothetical protein